MCFTTVLPDQERSSGMSDEIEKSRESIRVYENAIAMFERTRDAMHMRRRSAPDSVMIHLDASLKLNARALESLKRVLETAKEDLARKLDGR
jgi:hypothetical protein